MVQEDSKTCSAFESHNMLFHKIVSKVSVYTKTTLTVKMCASPFLAATVLVAFFQYTCIYSVYLNRKVNNILPI